MHQGLRLQWHGPGRPTPEFVAVNSGVLAEPAGDDGAPYFFARADWRAPTAEEQRLLFAEEATPFPDAVTVLAVEPGLREWFWDQVAPLVCLPDQATPEERQECLWDYARRVEQSLAKHCGITARSLRSCDVQVTPPDRNSTGFDYRKNRYVGLHVDNHDRLSLRERRGAFQLICLNVGTAERYLQFVNLAVPGLLAALGHDLDDAAEERYGTIRRLTGEFFEAQPSYPVVRLTLPPDHAYVAVTQYVVHDGATNTQGQPDVAFLLAGQFERS
jgi:hypothetical protein